jgi:hypothetical protein
MRTRSMTLPDLTADRLSVWTVTKSRDFLVKILRDLLAERALDEYDERLAINGYRKNHERRAQQPSFHKGLEDLVQASLVYSCS